MASFGSGFVLFVVVALPPAGASPMGYGSGVLWTLAATGLVLLGLAQVLQYARCLEEASGTDAPKVVMLNGGAPVSIEGLHLDLARKQFLLAARHQRPLSCIAVEVDQGSLGRLSNKAGWGTVASAVDSGVPGLVARAAAGATRRSDLTIGGSTPRRFFVLCPETGRAGATRVALKIDQALRQDLSLEVCTGVSEYPGDAASLDDLLQRAESELQNSGNADDPRQLELEFPGWDKTGSP